MVLSPMIWKVWIWGTGVPRKISTWLLFFCSWGRWRDILSHGRFKRRMTERDVETICRAILVYCLLHYRGDENIKGFIWDLISPAENGKTKELQNHSGDYQVFAFCLALGYLSFSGPRVFLNPSLQCIHFPRSVYPCASWTQGEKSKVTKHFWYP